MSQLYLQLQMAWEDQDDGSGHLYCRLEGYGYEAPANFEGKLSMEREGRGVQRATMEERLPKLEQTIGEHHNMLYNIAQKEKAAAGNIENPSE